MNVGDMCVYFTRAFIVVLVRYLSSTIDMCLWFALHAVATVQSDQILYCSIWLCVIADLYWVWFYEIIGFCYLLACSISAMSCVYFLSLDHRDFSTCMPGSAIHSPHFVTSFSCHTSHRWRLATQSNPLWSVVSKEPCAV